MGVRLEHSPICPGHAYFDMECPQTVIVHFCGHTDEPPVVCFDLRYGVKLTGTAVKLVQNIYSPDSKFCKG